MRTSIVCLATIIVGFGAVLADSGANHKQPLPLPIELGVSGGSAEDHVGRAFCCGATLGSAVDYDGNLHILSNNHVLARSGNAVPGEDTVQPGLEDTSCLATGSIVGDFIGDVVPLGSGLGGHNVDAALSLARPGAVDPSGFIMDIGVPCSALRAANASLIGAPVVKSGRTTGCLDGTVFTIDTTVALAYTKSCAGTGNFFAVTYTDQITTTVIASGGDSGSLLLTQSRLEPTALLFAGSSDFTIGNPVEHVKAAFESGGHSFDWVGSRVCTSTCSCTAENGFSCTGETSSATAPTATAVMSWAHPSEADVDHAREIKKGHEADLLARHDVLGVGIGSADKDASRAVIVIFVEARPGTRRLDLPSQIDGVQVKVVPTDPFVAF